MDSEEALDGLNTLDARWRDLELIAQKAGYEKTSDGNWRTRSKAHLINGDRAAREGGVRGYQDTYVRGSFIKAITQARSRDADEQRIGKATLNELTTYMDEAAVRAAGSKATLGLTDATGGWVMPNAVVDSITKAATYENVYRQICTVIPGVNAAAVDIPFRSGRPARAVIAAWGDTKENSNLAYNGYTATLYTLARIYDLGNQFVRKSAGAAEQDVLSELATAFALGEAYYIRQGAGTTEPYGLATALDAGPSTFRSAFTPSATTLAGSVLKAITLAAGALAARGVNRNISAVISGTAWGTMIGQGSDTGGFYYNGMDGDGIPGIAPGVILTPWGIPVYVDDQSTDDRLIVGDFKKLKLYFGESYRVDSSDEAGTRWDTNLTGFRGEEEMGVDARPAVYAGYFQEVTDLLA